MRHTIVLAGPPGSGKTTLAKIMRDMAGGNVRIIDNASLTDGSLQWYSRKEDHLIVTTRDMVTSVPHDVVVFHLSRLPK